LCRSDIRRTSGRFALERAEEEVIEVDGPDPIGGFLKPDVALRQGLAEEELARLESESAGVRDQADQVVTGILWLGQRRRIFAARRLPLSDRRLLPEGLVGASRL
jgi:hypothetical protein